MHVCHLFRALATTSLCSGPLGADIIMLETLAIVPLGISQASTLATKCAPTTQETMHTHMQTIF